MENTALLPQDEAQVVLDATLSVYHDADLYFATGKEHAGKIAAAAIRAAANQVVPANGSRKNNEIRVELLAIADELEAL